MDKQFLLPEVIRNNPGLFNLDITNSSSEIRKTLSTDKRFKGGYLGYDLMLYIENCSSSVDVFFPSDPSDPTERAGHVQPQGQENKTNFKELLTQELQKMLHGLDPDKVYVVLGFGISNNSDCKAIFPRSTFIHRDTSALALCVYIQHQLSIYEAKYGEFSYSLALSGRIWYTSEEIKAISELKAQADLSLNINKNEFKDIQTKIFKQINQIKQNNLLFDNKLTPSLLSNLEILEKDNKNIIYKLDNGVLKSTKINNNKIEYCVEIQGSSVCKWIDYLNEMGITRKSNEIIIQYNKTNTEIEHINISYKFRKMVEAAKEFRIDENIGVIDFETYKINEKGEQQVYAGGWCIKDNKPEAREASATCFTYYLGDLECHTSSELIVKLFKDIFDSPYSTYTFYIHNLSEFDSNFIIIPLSLNNFKVKTIIKDDNTIVSLTIKKEINRTNSKGKIIKVIKTIKLLDSYLLLNDSLRNLAESFNCTHKKGYFPYLFINTDTLNYVGPMPDKHYYNFDCQPSGAKLPSTLPLRTDGAKLPSTLRSEAPLNPFGAESEAGSEAPLSVRRAKQGEKHPSVLASSNHLPTTASNNNQQRQEDEIDIYKKISNELKNTFSVKDETLKYLKLDLLSLHEVLVKFSNIIFTNFSVNITKVKTYSGLSLYIYLSNYYNVDYEISLIKGDVEKNLRKSVFGGLVHLSSQSNKQGFKMDEGYYYDGNSMYPSLMLKKMPVGDPILSDDTNLDNYFGFCFVNIIPPKDKLDVFLIPYRDENGRIYCPSQPFTGLYFSEMLKESLKYGYTIKVFGGYKFKDKNIFTSFVSDLYKKRLEASQQRKELNKLVNSSSAADKIKSSLEITFKLILNSLSGRMGMKNIDSSVIIVTKDEALEILNKKNIISYLNLTQDLVLIKYNNNVSDEILKLSFKFFEDDQNPKSIATSERMEGSRIENADKTNNKANNKANKNSGFYLKNKNIGVSSSVPISSAILSYCIAEFMKFKNIIGNPLLYNDTDSLIFKHPLPDKFLSETDLGKLKLVDHIKEGYFISPKFYAYKNMDNKVVLKHKGIKKGLLKYENYIDIFNGKDLTIKTLVFNKSLSKGTVFINYKDIIIKGRTTS